MSCLFLAQLHPDLFMISSVFLEIQTFPEISDYVISPWLFSIPTASYHSTCLLELAKHYIEARTLPPLEFCHFSVVLSEFSESWCFNEHKLNSPSKKGPWARVRNCRNYEVAARQMQTDVRDIFLFVNKQTAQHANWASLVENIKVMTSIK